MQCARLWRNEDFLKGSEDVIVVFMVCFLASVTRNKVIHYIWASKCRRTSFLNVKFRAQSDPSTSWDKNMSKEWRGEWSNNDSSGWNWDASTLQLAGNGKAFARWRKLSTEMKGSLLNGRIYPHTVDPTSMERTHTTQHSQHWKNHWLQSGQRAWMFFQRLTDGHVWKATGKDARHR